jgi:alkylation response protein AidB-like acyl-CoA dehydrogenase
MSEKQHGHILLGEAHARAMIAEELVREQVRQTDTLAAGPGFELGDRLRLKAHTGFVVNLCREAVNDMAHHGGSTSYRRDAPLQRFFRDMNMLATHAFWEWDTCRELYGRDLLGLDPNHPLV